MKNKALLMLACCLILASSIHCAGMSQRLYDYLRSRWAELSHSSYTSLIPKKTLSYVLPAMSIVPGAILGRIVAEEKFILPMSEDPLWATIIPRRNSDIVRSWSIIGGLAALVITYKMLSYYLQKPPSKNSDETPSEQ